MTYQVKIQTRVKRAMGRLSLSEQDDFLKAIACLGANPFPPESKRMESKKGYFRLKLPKHAAWRVVYHVDGNALLVTAVDFGTRGDIYKRSKRNY